MIGSIVLPSAARRGMPPSSLERQPPVDPLSEILALMKPQTYAAGGFAVAENAAIYFPQHEGVKCYAMMTGECWICVEGAPEPTLLQAGDCFILPRGLPFRLTTDLSLEPILYSEFFARFGKNTEPDKLDSSTRYMAGGFFSLTGSHARIILDSLPPIVHIRRESDREAMRWSIDRMREELRNPQAGGSLIAQQLAYMMLVQALRLHLSDEASKGRGWLFALADKQMSVAISRMHSDPGYPWTVQSLAECVGMSRSVFALRFREVVGVTPMEYLTRWRMILAGDRLKTSSDSLAEIAQSLGYESESAFGKAFRRAMGHSPRQFARHSGNSVPEHSVAVAS